MMERVQALPDDRAERRAAARGLWRGFSRDGELELPEQVLQLAPLLWREGSKVMTKEISFTACWTTCDRLHDRELLEETTQQGQDLEWGHLTRGAQEWEGGEAGEGKEGLDLVEIESFDQEITTRPESADHRHDLRDDQREMDELLVLFVSSLLHATISTDKVHSVSWSLRWQSCVDKATEGVDVGTMQEISSGVRTTHQIKESNSLLLLLLLLLPLLGRDDECVRRSMQMVKIPVARRPLRKEQWDPWANKTRTMTLRELCQNIFWETTRTTTEISPCES
jgi:hypothetical protein